MNGDFDGLILGVPLQSTDELQREVRRRLERAEPVRISAEYLIRADTTIVRSLAELVRDPAMRTSALSFVGDSASIHHAERLLRLDRLNQGESHEPIA